MRVCLFCGSSEGNRPAYAAAAEGFGEAIAAGSHELIYGGARIGLMGIAADAALRGGSQVIGIIPHGLADRELAHERVTELIRVDTMHERKFEMSQRADAFAVLPGGAGTHDEFFEMWTWVQIGVHDKPIGFLNVDGFFDPLFAYVDHMIEEGFLRGTYRDTLVIADQPDALLLKLAEYGGTPTKWED